MARVTPRGKVTEAGAAYAEKYHLSRNQVKGLNDADIAGLIEIRENNIEAVTSGIHTAIAAALEEIGLAAERFAKRETPVDTGRLRNSITHVISTDEQAVYVGTNVPYGRFVELGVKGRAGVHMLQNAASNHQDYYRGIVKKHLQGGG